MLPISVPHKHTFRLIMSTESPQVKAVRRYIDYLKVLNFTEIEKLLAVDFVQDTRPMSLRVPIKDKDEYKVFLYRLAEQLEGRSIEIDNVRIADASVLAKKVFAHFTIHGKPLGGEPFDMEAIYIFTFSQADTKIRILATFVDSKHYPWAT
ncbi:hypothetical protein EDB92DRAFT_291419 [Lactarius akahatsu]|uniref:SnoaL-like domain-containing protein n=1 Tax=Lactarius akahatsu TaxID=416441 RepID=A0AAD4LIR6_9AGAM|nr:hypothetical protein EDB92DRAFT_291419 [Lactarius akahatsu]